jgi:hypothetical protein
VVDQRDHAHVAARAGEIANGALTAYLLSRQ